MAANEVYRKPGTTQSAAPNNSSAAFANAITSRFVRIYSPTADCFIKIGKTAPTAAATDFPVVAGIPEIIDLEDIAGVGRNKHVAVFCSVATTVYVTPMF